MVIENWEIEELDRAFTDSLQLEKVTFDGELSVTLLSTTHKIELVFRDIISFRVHDESVLLKYWGTDYEAVDGKYFYQIKNSSYHEEMKMLSLDFTVLPEPESINHYCVFLEDDCIEILCYNPPAVQLFKL